VNSASISEAPPRSLLGYPRGAWLIISVEFWERFSFYGMLAILVLFLNGDAAHGGFGWSAARALSLYGFYSFAMYAFPAFGGYLADHVFGRRRAVALGASVMLIGQALLPSPAYLPALLGLWHGAPLPQALRSLPVPLGELHRTVDVAAAIVHRGAALDPTHGVEWLSQAYAAAAIGFYAAIFLLILGNALMKSTLVVLCGETFRPDDPQRDGAFAYYYLGISVGAMLSGFAVGYVSELFGWSYGFAVAAVGMAVSLSLYLTLGPRWLKGIGERKPRSASRPSSVDTPSAVPAQAQAQDASVTARGSETVRRITLVLLLAVLMCMFSTGWNQMGGSWTLFIEKSVNRGIGSFVVPVPWFQSIEAIVVIGVAPLVAALWVRAAARNRPIDIVRKYFFALGMAMLANGLMYVAGLMATHGAKAPIWIPVLGVSLLGLGEIVAWTATYGVVTSAAPAGFVSATMGAWYLLTLGLGGYLSGVTGQWVDSIGYAATFGGIAAAMALAAVLALLLRAPLLRLAKHVGVTL
jgi:proton-dependent oligopeptide transporter, POT family